MCAQKNDAAFEFMTDLYVKHNKLWKGYRTKRVILEKAYLEKNFERHKVSVEREFQLLHRIYKTIKVLKKYLVKREFVNNIKMTNSLSSGQKKYYGLLLKMYELEPRFFTILEITEQNKIPKKRRSTIQRFFMPSTKNSFKWKRGNIIIKEFLETKFEIYDRKKRRQYKPIGPLATISEIFSQCRNALTCIDENSDVFQTNYDSLNDIITNSKQITENERSLIKQTIREYEKKIKKKVPDEKRFLDNMTSIYHGNEELLQDQIFIFKKRLEHRTQLHEYCEKVKNIVNEIQIKNFFKLDEKDCKILLSLIHDLSDIILRDFEILEHCLFIMEIVKAKIRSEDLGLLGLKSEGVEPYIELANTQDERLERGSISEKMYKIRISVIKSTIKGYLQDRANV